MTGEITSGRRTVLGDLLLGVLVDESIEEAHRVEIDQRIAAVLDGFALFKQSDTAERGERSVSLLRAHSGRRERQSGENGSSTGEVHVNMSNRCRSTMDCV